MRGTLGACEHTILGLKKELEELKTAKAKDDKEFEEYKVKTQSQFDAFAKRIQYAELVNQALVDAAKLVLEMIHLVGASSSSSNSLQLLPQLKTAPAALRSNM
ncbi:hypothetical protein E2562_028353 [Oryza meyeriana var. granulata]|uniref:Uncharacterized protein n=1 Tax=Oryza meyeriana var. granulata TaxID=110450 RepID=A0A6G1CU31_9ORYZ|nr:hypothetical protein E2562_028353 [Oryza meyeriana var. granulata]